MRVVASRESDNVIPYIISQLVSPAVVCPRPGYEPNRKEYGVMQSYPSLWQAALIVRLCVLTSPLVAQEPSREPEAGERAGSPAHDHAESATDQALAERIRQSLQENAPLSGAAQN